MGSCRGVLELQSSFMWVPVVRDRLDKIELFCLGSLLIVSATSGYHRALVVCLGQYTTEIFRACEKVGPRPSAPRFPHEGFRTFGFVGFRVLSRRAESGLGPK